MAKGTESLDVLFSGLPDPAAATIIPFFNADHFGFLIKWGKKGVGWGEITLACDRALGQWTMDAEHMSLRFVAEIFQRLAEQYDAEAARVAEARKVRR